MSKEEITKVLDKLHDKYPNLEYYLDFSNPFELVMAAILSSRVRDEVVNNATPELFEKYQNPEDLANADVDELRSIISSVSYAGQKAKWLKKTGKTLVEEYNSEVPKEVNELTDLTGVGKKTANVIQQNAFDIVNGIVVDTHVLRVSHRLGWTSTDEDAEKVEEELKNKIPKDEWKELPLLLKDHGRNLCTARNPECNNCPVEEECPKIKVNK